LVLYLSLISIKNTLGVVAAIFRLLVASLYSHVEDVIIIHVPIQFQAQDDRIVEALKLVDTKKLRTLLQVQGDNSNSVPFIG